MNVKETDLKTLSIIWSNSVRDLESRSLIEAELQIRILNNQVHSLESIVENNLVYNKVLNIFFIPTSKSFQKLGDFVTLNNLKIEKKEFEDYIKNTISEPPINTYGIIKGEVLTERKVTNESSESENEPLTKIVVFNTYDILKIEGRNLTK